MARLFGKKKKDENEQPATRDTATNDPFERFADLMKDTHPHGDEPQMLEAFEPDKTHRQPRAGRRSRTLETGPQREFIPLEPPPRDKREEHNPNAAVRLGGAVGSAGYRTDREEDPSAPRISGLIAPDEPSALGEKGKIQRISARDLLPTADPSEIEEVESHAEAAAELKPEDENSGASAIRSFGAGRQKGDSRVIRADERTEEAPEIQSEAPAETPSEPALEPFPLLGAAPETEEPEEPRFIDGSFGEARASGNSRIFDSDSRPTISLEAAPAHGRLNPANTGKIVLAQGPLTLEVMQRNFDAALASEKRPEVMKLLAEMDFMPESALLELLSRYERPVEIDLAKILPSDVALQQIPREVALAHGVVPVALIGDVLIVAMAPPLKPEAVADLRYLTGKLIKLCVANVDHLELTLTRVYRHGGPLLDDPPQVQRDPNVSTRLTLSQIPPGVPQPSITETIRRDDAEGSAPSNPLTGREVARPYNDPLADAARIFEDFDDTKDQAVQPEVDHNPRADALRDKLSAAAHELHALEDEPREETRRPDPRDEYARDARRPDPRDDYARDEYARDPRRPDPRDEYARDSRDPDSRYGDQGDQYARDDRYADPRDPYQRPEREAQPRSYRDDDDLDNPRNREAVRDSEIRPAAPRDLAPAYDDLDADEFDTRKAPVRPSEDHALRESRRQPEAPRIDPESMRRPVIDPRDAEALANAEVEARLHALHENQARESAAARAERERLEDEQAAALKRAERAELMRLEQLKAEAEARADRAERAERAERERIKQEEEEAEARAQRAKRAQAEAEASAARARARKAEQEAERLASMRKPKPVELTPEDPGDSTQPGDEPVIAEEPSPSHGQRSNSRDLEELPQARPMPRPTHGHDVPVSQRIESAPPAAKLPEAPPLKPQIRAEILPDTSRPQNRQTKSIQLPGNKLSSQFDTRAPSTKRQILPSSDDTAVEDFGEFK